MAVSTQADDTNFYFFEVSSAKPIHGRFMLCYRSTSIRSAYREQHKPEGRAAAHAVFCVLMSRKIGAAFGFDASTRLHAHAAAAGPSAGSHMRSITDARTRASKTAFGRPGVVNIEKPSSQISAVRTCAVDSTDATCVHTVRTVRTSSLSLDSVAKTSAGTQANVLTV